MSFFPLFTCFAGRVSCSLEVVNFAPNSWEIFENIERNVYLTRRCHGYWSNEKIASLKPEEVIIIDAREYNINDGELAAITITSNQIKSRTDSLPLMKSPTSYPEFRAKICIKFDGAKAAYQGEMVAFPEKRGTSLFFDVMPQISESIERYLVLLNFEKTPGQRKGELVVSQVSKCSRAVSKIEILEVLSNAVTVLSLRDVKMRCDLKSTLMFTSSIGVIPYFLAQSADSEVLSFEHTHPPSSLVVQGDRIGIQKIIKETWFSRQS